MGGCLTTIIQSLFGGEGSTSNSKSTTELVTASSSISASAAAPASFAVDPAHSSETIETCNSSNNTDDDDEAQSSSSVSSSSKSKRKSNSGEMIQGRGLALSSVIIEQDSAYWEIHVSITHGDDDNNNDNDNNNNDNNASFNELLKCGVAKQCPRSELNSMTMTTMMEENNDDSNRLFFLRGIPNLVDGDVVGVAVQHSDLPMVQFLVNGEPLHHMAINRFRGAVHPAVWLDNNNDKESRSRCCVRVEFMWDEGRWKHEPPHGKFTAIMLARSIV